jgi:hypothetical protein
MSEHLQNFGDAVSAFAPGATIEVVDAHGACETSVLQVPLRVNQVIAHSRGGVIKVIERSQGTGSSFSPYVLAVRTDRGDRFTCTLRISAPTEQEDAVLCEPTSRWGRCIAFLIR